MKNFSSSSATILCFVTLLVPAIFTISSATAQQQQLQEVERSSNKNKIVVKVEGKEFGPVPESTCTTFLNSSWCPSSLMCVVAPNSSEAAKSHCNKLCETPCSNFSNCQTCASDERNCGDCMFAGGVWSMKRQECFPDITFCEEKQDTTCVEEDRLCPQCDRYNRPVTCLPLFPLAIAVLSSAFLFALCGSIWVFLHWAAPVTDEEVNAQTRLPQQERNISIRASRAAGEGGIVAVPVQNSNGETTTQYLVPVSAATGTGADGQPTIISPRLSAASPAISSPRRSSNAALLPAGATIQFAGKQPGASGKNGNKWGTVRTAVLLTANGTRLSAAGGPNSRSPTTTTTGTKTPGNVSTPPPLTPNVASSAGVTEQQNNNNTSELKPSTSSTYAQQLLQKQRSESTSNNPQDLRLNSSEIRGKSSLSTDFNSPGTTTTEASNNNNNSGKNKSSRKSRSNTNTSNSANTPSSTSNPGGDDQQPLLMNEKKNSNDDE